MKTKLENRTINEMTPCEIMTSMNPEDKDALYRLLWSDYVYNDVVSRITDEHSEIQFQNDEERDSFVECIVNRYVYDGDYDCGISYWDNIDNLIKEESDKL